MLKTERKGLSLEMVFTLIITLVGFSVGLIIINQLDRSPISWQKYEPEIKGLISEGIKCRSFSHGQKIDESDFAFLTYAKSIGECNDGSNVVKLNFSLKKDDLNRLDAQFKISEEGPLYVEGCRKIRAYDGLVVDKSNLPLRKGDKANITREGSSVLICKS